MAMLGFAVTGEAPIRFDLGITVASLLTAIVVVAIGLFIVGYGRPSALKIIAAGIFTGVGVAGMHYTGMAAMQIPATVTYDREAGRRLGRDRDRGRHRRALVHRDPRSAPWR